MDVDKKWLEKGYIDEPVDESVDLHNEIRNLCKQKNAIILAHYYTTGDIQDVSLSATLWLLRVRLLIQMLTL